ncbi:MAG TPA: family 43 glycosylhydrolase [Candidatus Saccharimonadales bacterium]
MSVSLEAPRSRPYPRYPIDIGALVVAATGADTSPSKPIDMGGGADPYIVDGQGYYEGKKIYAHTENYACTEVRFRVADTLADLPKARPQVAFDHALTAKPGEPRPHATWAQEFGYANGMCFSYYSGGTSRDHGYQTQVLAGWEDEPLNKMEYVGQLDIPIESELVIDASRFEIDDEAFLVLSALDEKAKMQGLYLLPMKDLWTAAGDPVLVSEPRYRWEKKGGRHGVNEGGQHVQRMLTLGKGKEKVKRDCIEYAGGPSWDDPYSTGRLIHTPGTEVLDQDNWTKQRRPILSRYKSMPGVRMPGVGHGSYIKEGDSDFMALQCKKFRGSGWLRQCIIAPYYETPDNKLAFY